MDDSFTELLNFEINTSEVPGILNNYSDARQQMEPICWAYTVAFLIEDTIAALYKIKCIPVSIMWIVSMLYTRCPYHIFRTHNPGQYVNGNFKDAANSQKFISNAVDCPEYIYYKLEVCFPYIETIRWLNLNKPGNKIDYLHDITFDDNINLKGSDCCLFSEPLKCKILDPSSINRYDNIHIKSFQDLVFTVSSVLERHNYIKQILKCQNRPIFTTIAFTYNYNSYVNQINRGLENKYCPYPDRHYYETSTSYHGVIIYGWVNNPVTNEQFWKIRDPNTIIDGGFYYYPFSKSMDDLNRIDACEVVDKMFFIKDIEFSHTYTDSTRNMNESYFEI